MKVQEVILKAMAGLAGTAAFIPYLPAAKLGNNNYISIYTSGNYNWWQISVPATTAAGGGITAGPGLTVAQAYGIDRNSTTVVRRRVTSIDSYVTGGGTPAVTQSASSSTVSATTCDNAGTPVPLCRGGGCSPRRSISGSTRSGGARRQRATHGSGELYMEGV